MNNMEKIAEMLGIRMGDKFTIDGYTDEYTLTSAGLFKLADDNNRHRNDDLLVKLIVGELKLNTPPWRARCGEVYYIPNIGLYDTTEIRAGENPQLDEEMYIKGFMCRTMLEAAELSRIFSDLALKLKED